MEIKESSGPIRKLKRFGAFIFHYELAALLVAPFLFS